MSLPIGKHIPESEPLISERGRRSQTRTERNYYIGCRYLREKKGNGPGRPPGNGKNVANFDSTAERIAAEEGYSHQHVKNCAKMARQIEEACAGGLSFLKWPGARGEEKRARPDAPFWHTTEELLLRRRGIAAMHFKTSDVVRQVGKNALYLQWLIRSEKLTPPRKDSSGDYVWTPADVGRVKQALRKVKTRKRSARVKG